MNRELKGEIVKRFGSQFAFAHALGWHEASVSRVVCGHIQLADEEKQRWAKILGADQEKLFEQAGG
jgi:plasmid maintenance system antidote protein VapI